METWRKQILVFFGILLLVGCSSSPSEEDELEGDWEDESAETTEPVADTDAAPESDTSNEETTTADSSAEPSPSPTDEPLAEPTPEESPLAQTEPLAEEPAAEMPPLEIPESTPPSSGSGIAQTHRVRRGETLMKIAFEVYGDLYQWKKIYEMNRSKISNPNALEPGIELELEAPTDTVMIDRSGDSYTIKSGDTLGSISNQLYGTPSRWKELWNKNRQLIKNPNKIYAGFSLYYEPSGGMTSESTPSSSESLSKGDATNAPSEPAPEGDTSADEDPALSDGTPQAEEGARTPSSP